MKQVFAWVTSLLIFLFSGTTLIKAIEHDLRPAQMRAVLTKYNSPMVGLEDTLIATAEQYHLDWTILAAIAGTESSFGKRMPYQCINPYGWGIYGDHKLCFESFEASITGVAQGLAGKYNTTSLESIARTYNTVSTEAWTSHTRFFMNKIKNAEVPVHALPITL